MAELEKQQSSIGNAELAQRLVQFVMMQAHILRPLTHSFTGWPAYSAQS